MAADRSQDSRASGLYTYPCRLVIRDGSNFQVEHISIKRYLNREHQI